MAVVGIRAIVVVEPGYTGDPQTVTVNGVEITATESGVEITSESGASELLAFDPTQDQTIRQVETDGVVHTVSATVVDGVPVLVKAEDGVPVSTVVQSDGTVPFTGDIGREWTVGADTFRWELYESADINGTVYQRHHTNGDRNPPTLVHSPLVIAMLIDNPVGNNVGVYCDNFDGAQLVAGGKFLFLNTAGEIVGNVEKVDFGSGPILTSPNGTKWQPTIDNAGAVTYTALP